MALPLAQRQRIVAAWLNMVAVPYIAWTEGLSEDAVKAVIAIAARQPRRTPDLGQSATHPQI